jgi:hypothetical protein
MGVAAVLMALPGLAQAAPVGLTALGEPDIQVSPVTLDYSAASDVFTVGMTPLGPVTGNGLVIAADGTSLAAADLAISIDVRIGDIAGAPVPVPGGGGLSITGQIYDDDTVGGPVLASGTLLTGDLIATGFDETTIELGWNLTGGTYAAEFGGTGMLALTLINAASFFDPDTAFSQDFSAALFDFSISTDTQAAVGNNLEEIPLPAGLPLMLTGLGALALLRRHASGRSRRAD